MLTPATARPSTQTPGLERKVLIVDDERNIRTTLALCVEREGFRTIAASSLRAAVQEADRTRFDLAFVDLRLGAESGLDLVPQLLAKQPGLPIVMITAYATIDSAAEAIRRGATDYVAKPFTPAQIRLILDRLTDVPYASQTATGLEQLLSREVPESDFSTRSPAMQRVLDVALRAAESEAPILLRGESGTGKGVLARAIHAISRRSASPFMVVNCPTLSGDLLASELFGHAKGAFTGAVRDQPGRVEAAKEGTLFLDEITEVAPSLQAKLLRFLQEKRFERVGETKTRHADVRLVAATNRDLAEEVRQGRFRQDLLFRLNVIELELPPLRARPEDIVPLARGFLAFFARSASRRYLELAPEAEVLLMQQTWPGNIRELRNTIERAAILSSSTRIGPEAFPSMQKAETHQTTGFGQDCSLEMLEQAHIRAVVARHPLLEDAARILGIDASTLWRKRKRYGI